MFHAFIIVLREGFEAFLIVSVITAYLKRTGRSALLPAVSVGVLTALAASAGLGFCLSDRGYDPLWEGILGLVAVVFVSTLMVQMWRQGGRARQDTEQRLEKVAARAGAWAVLDVFLFTVLMIAREGVETALMLVQVRDPGFLWGVGLWGCSSRRLSP